MSERPCSRAISGMVFPALKAAMKRSARSCLILADCSFLTRLARLARTWNGYPRRRARYGGGLRLRHPKRSLLRARDRNAVEDPRAARVASKASPATPSLTDRRGMASGTTSRDRMAQRSSDAGNGRWRLSASIRPVADCPEAPAAGQRRRIRASTRSSST